MKAIIQSLSATLAALFVVTTITSCDPCGNAVCEYGTCSNGTCVCETGYVKDGISCVGVNSYYNTTDGAVSASVTTQQGTGTPQTTNNVAYTISTPKDSPYMLKIVNFLSVTGNDVIFTVKDNNYTILRELTVITTAAKTYEVSGARVGTQVQLNIRDLATNTTYAINYRTK